MAMEPISITVLKIHRQNKEINQYNISGITKPSDNPLAGTF